MQQLAEQIDWAAGGAGLNAQQVQALADEWEPLARPGSKGQELFDLVTPAGEPTGVTAPRWLCHLLGLCHRTVHLALVTPQGWLVLQVRSRHVDWPGCLDLAVTGHVKAGLSWEEAVQAEAAEELGLHVDPAAGLVAESGFALAGAHLRRGCDSRNPPVHICHATRVYVAHLTAAGLASLRFADGEVSALYLCSTAETQRLIAEEPQRVAPGLAQSLPHYCAWASSVMQPQG